MYTTKALLSFACGHALLQLGCTPLHAAVSSSSVAVTEMVELLLAAGAAVDARKGVRGRCLGGYVKDGAWK